MKIHGFLQPFMHALFQGNPGITTPEAVASIRDFLTRQDKGKEHIAEAADIGYASVWGNFTGGLRQKAVAQLKTATVAIASDGGLTIQVFENMKLPLPDADLSPTYADSTALMLRESIRYMQTQVQGMKRQIDFATKIADLLEVAGLAVNEPALTVRAACSRGLVDWANISTTAVSA